MKMLMAIVDNRRKEEFELVLQKEGVQGWTEIPHVRGMGSTGPRLESAAWPESSAIIQVLVPDERIDALVQMLQRYCSQCREHIKLLHWDVTVVM
ncbi:MAG: PG0541 family transporter-associated protein [Candidatus Delongbacteria bacterium]